MHALSRATPLGRFVLGGEGVMPVADLPPDGIVAGRLGVDPAVGLEDDLAPAVAAGRRAHRDSSRSSRAASKGVARYLSARAC